MGLNAQFFFHQVCCFDNCSVSITTGIFSDLILIIVSFSVSSVDLKKKKLKFQVLLKRFSLVDCVFKIIYLQDNLSIISNGMNTLDKFIDATFSNILKNQQRKKKSDKQQQAQNIKDPILET